MFQSKKTHARSNGFLHANDGASATEFALVLVPMTIFFVLIMQFGILLFVHNDMYNAARDAARQMAVSENTVYSNSASICSGSMTSRSVEKIACDHLSLWSGNITFTVTPIVTASSTAGVCDQIEIQVSANMADATIFNVLGALTGKTLFANAIMRSQYDILDDSGNATSGNCA